MLDLRDKNVLILGGSGLIGSSIVSELIKIEANIIILDIKKDKNFINTSKKIKFFRFDMTNSKFEINFKNILKKIDKIDCFINCAYPFTKNWSDSNFNKLTYDSSKQTSK